MLVFSYILGLLTPYMLGFVLFACHAYVNYRPENGHSPLWFEKWPGRPFAAFVDGLIWPYHIYSAVKNEW